MGETMEPRARVAHILCAHACCIEREAAERYTQYQEYFVDRSLPALAQLCARLAGEHRADLARLGEALGGETVGTVDSSPHHWISSPQAASPASEFLFRVASPSRLLELAAAAEGEASLFYAGVARDTGDESLHDLARDVARRSRERADRLAGWVPVAPAHGVDWEPVLESGGGPCLALGAERRSRPR